jgi:hypothetical protein
LAPNENYPSKTNDHDRPAIRGCRFGFPTWRLLSRIDARRRDASSSIGAGLDPVALLIYDRSATSPRSSWRDRSSAPGTGRRRDEQNPGAGGHDAYRELGTVNDATGLVTQRLDGSLSQANVGAVLSREERRR